MKKKVVNSPRKMDHMRGGHTIEVKTYTQLPLWGREGTLMFRYSQCSCGYTWANGASGWWNAA